jgi:hypothetical protein
MTDEFAELVEIVDALCDTLARVSHMQSPLRSIAARARALYRRSVGVDDKPAPPVDMREPR